MKKISLLLLLSFALISCATGSDPGFTQNAKRVPTQQRAELKNLPQEQQAAWQDYFQRSHNWANMDRQFINDELAKTGHKEPVKPPAANKFGFDPKKPAEFYKTPEGRNIADIILSFQTPSGGWSKRTDMTRHARKPGEAFGTESSYIPTFDNKATIAQLHVLALAFEATKNIEYADAFQRGLHLILQAQFPNGGWPQSYPLTGSYHDYITYNDDVIVQLLSLLLDVVEKKPPFNFTPASIRQAAASSLQRGIDCLFKTQVTVDGKKTVWGAQHDTFTLTPQSARAYEPAALSSQESARILEFLMQLNNPSAEMVAAIDGAAAWFEATQITGYKWNHVNGESASLDAVKDAGPLWARFYEIGSNRPVFGDRNGSVQYDVTKISRERQIKYAWYTEVPAKILGRYEKWKNPGKK